jgi:hypothetical protein
MASKTKYEFIVFVRPENDDLVVIIAAGHKNKETMTEAWRIASMMLKNGQVSGFMATDVKTGEIMGEKGETEWTSKS